MAHTLTFHESFFNGASVTIQDRGVHQAEWRVVYKDNVTIIVESIPSNIPVQDHERRVYKVREWCRFDRCRATRME